mgnify:FL=1
MINTGLLPLENSHAILSIDMNIPAIPKSNCWKNSFVVTPDPIHLWDQFQTSVFYGYEDNFYDVKIRNSLKCKNVFDKEIFEFGAIKINGTAEPFLTQVVTKSMHQPFEYVTEDTDWILQADSIDMDVRKYLNCVHYFDKYLGEFLQALKDNGKYGNTIITIMGDHYVHNSDFKLRSNYCPIVILNSGCPKELIPHPQNMQQIDIYPTLLDLMGGNKYGWKGLGHSIFRSDEPNDEEALFKLSEQLILSDYFKHQKY